MRSSRGAGDQTPAGTSQEGLQPALRTLERGQTLVMVALSAVVLGAFLALVIDLGGVYAQRRMMQGAADAGALAGVRRLALELPFTAIDTHVREYTCIRNGADNYELGIVSDTVTVTVSKVCRMYFAPLLGVHQMTVGASATAGYGFPGSWQGNLMPIAVHKDAVEAICAVTCTVEIWDDAAMASDPEAGWISGGQRGWLNFNGEEVPATELAYWITNGYQGKVDVGDWINGTPGTKTSALQAMQIRVGKQIVVPVYDDIRPGQAGNGEIDYRICGFAAFLITSIVDTGSPKYVKGSFQRMVAAQEAGGTWDSGVRVINLQ